jgi:hypothetical protein
MNGVLWLRLVSTGLAILPVWVMLTVLLPFKPWFGRLKWLLGLDLVLGFVLAMLMTWGWVHP